MRRARERTGHPRPPYAIRDRQEMLRDVCMYCCVVLCCVVCCVVLLYCIILNQGGKLLAAAPGGWVRTEEGRFIRCFLHSADRRTRRGGWVGLPLAVVSDSSSMQILYAGQ